MGKLICKLFIYTYHGCDTNSRIYSIRKGALFNRFWTGKEFEKYVIVFMEGSASTALFVETGERILVKLFGGRECNTLNELCFTSFIKNLLKVRVC